MAKWPQQLGILACVISAGLVPQIASASSAADFYKGKTVKMIVGYHPGGGYDTYARLIGRYWDKHIPGKPSMIIENMPGAGSRIAADHVAKVSPKDGTEVGMIAGAVAISPLIRPAFAKFKGSDFTWIGSPTRATGICLSWHTAPVKTLEDVKKTQIIAGAASGSTSNTYTYPLILREALGVKFKIVSGYPGSSGLMKAIQSGEIQAFCGNVYATIRTRHPAWLKEHKVNILVQMALRKNPDLDGVPLVMDLVKDTKYYDIFRLLVGSQAELGRPILAPSGVAKYKIDALRQSFNETIKSSELHAQAKKLRLDIDLVTGEQLQNFVDEMYAMPKDVIQAASKFVGVNPGKKKKKK